MGQRAEGDAGGERERAHLGGEDGEAGEQLQRRRQQLQEGGQRHLVDAVERTQQRVQRALGGRRRQPQQLAVQEARERHVRAHAGERQILRRAPRTAPAPKR